MGLDSRGEEEPVTGRLEKRELREEMQVWGKSFNKTEFGKARSPEENGERWFRTRLWAG